MLFVPAFAFIGATNQQREWLGAIMGVCVGLFFALAMIGRLLAWLSRALDGDSK